MNKKVTVLLTGGSGFIGRNIVEQLGDRYDFLAPSHAELELSDTEAVEKYLKEHRPDIIIHAANLGGTRKNANLAGVTHVNLRNFFNIVRCKEYFGRLIMLGSGAEYDRIHPIKNVSEDAYDKHVPVEEYGFYKYVCSKYAESVDFITHLRLFGVYGKYEDYEMRFISNAICKALIGLPITIKQNLIFDYCYAPDVVKIIQKFIETKPKQKFYNVCGQHLELQDIAERILKVTKTNVPIEIEKDGMGKEYSGNCELLCDEFSGLVFTDINDGIHALANYYRQILPSIDKQALLTDV